MFFLFCFDVLLTIPEVEERKCDVHIVVMTDRLNFLLCTIYAVCQRHSLTVKKSSRRDVSEASPSAASVAVLSHSHTDTTRFAIFHLLRYVPWSISFCCGTVIVLLSPLDHKVLIVIDSVGGVGVGDGGGCGVATSSTN